MESYFLTIKDDDFNMQNRLLQYISYARYQKLSHYYYNIDKKLSLYGELIVRMVISRSLGCHPRDIKIEENYYGKPYISNFKNVFFNISHTKKAVLCVISNIEEIGVDIENIDNFSFAEINQICHTNELNFLNTLSAEAKKIEFCKIWTRKEAFGKKVGVGIGQNLKQINTLIPEKNKKYITWINGSYICSAYCNQKESINNIIVNERNIKKYFLSI